MTAVVAATMAVAAETMDPVDVTFLFDSEEPFEVQMTLSAPDCECGCSAALPPITLHFARDLIDAALVRPGHVVGLGDISFEVLAEEPEFLRVSMAGPGEERYPLIMPAVAARDFMIRSYMLVPAYAAAADVDTAISNLLGAS